MLINVRRSDAGQMWKLLAHSLLDTWSQTGPQELWQDLGIAQGVVGQPPDEWSRSFGALCVSDASFPFLSSNSVANDLGSHDRVRI